MQASQFGELCGLRQIAVSWAVWLCILYFILHVTASVGHRRVFIHSFISIQPWRPGWQEPEPPSHVTGMALAHCILGKFLGVVCHCFPALTVIN